jgi:enoyl-CoA hydratase/carnithine racemase
MIITLDRAIKKNAITDEMYGEIAGALAHAAVDEEARVVVLVGDGPDFCAGNDISMLADTAAGTQDIATSNVGRFLTALSTFPKPLVAIVTGRAIGVGATMLLHCDLVYVASDAQLILPFVNLGLVPEAGSAWLLPQRIGHVRAFALMALGERLSGADAAKLGLANVALPTAELTPAAMEAARTLASKSPSALAATKRLMRDAHAIEAAIAADRKALLLQLARPEAAAAFSAFATRKSNQGQSGVGNAGLESTTR